MIATMTCIHTYARLCMCVCGLCIILLRFVPKDVMYIYVCVYVCRVVVITHIHTIAYCVVGIFGEGCSLVV